MTTEVKMPTPKDMGILASINTVGPGGIRTEKELTDQVMKQNNVTEKRIVNVTSSMFVDKYQKPWRDEVNGLRAWMHNNNPPFGPDNVFVANGLIDTFQAEVDRRMAFIANHREYFMKNLPQMESHWVQKGGNVSANSNQKFPSREDMEDKLRVKVEYKTCSDEYDVRLGGLIGDRRARYEEAVKQTHRDAVQGVVRHIASQVQTTVGHVLVKCGDPDKGGFIPRDGKNKQENGFKSSLIGNCRTLAGLLEHWNITNDPEVDRVRSEILTEIATLDPKKLKEDPALRERAHASAERILSRVGSFGRSDQAPANV